MSALVELADPWHPKGYRLWVPLRDGEIPPIMTSVWEEGRAVRITGRYDRTGIAPDGVPVFTWLGVTTGHGVEQPTGPVPKVVVEAMSMAELQEQVPEGEEPPLCPCGRYRGHSDACRLYDVLVREAGAPDGEVQRAMFAEWHADLKGRTAEYRFMGDLGYGGKLWWDTQRGFRVDCYLEDEYPLRTAIIERTNAALDAVTRRR